MDLSEGRSGRGFTGDRGPSVQEEWSWRGRPIPSRMSVCEYPNGMVEGSQRESFRDGDVEGAPVGLDELPVDVV